MKNVHKQRCCQYDEWKSSSSPHTRLDNFASSAAAILAFFPANSLFSTASELHYNKEKDVQNFRNGILILKYPFSLLKAPTFIH